MWLPQNASMELRETFFTEDLTSEAVDSDAYVIRGVRVLGAVSRNGRTYAEDAMRRAVGLYEGARLNFNHLDRANAARERHFEDWVGELRNVRYVEAEKALRGDAHILQSDPRTPKLMEAARRFPRSFGLSHVAEGRENKSRIVEHIEAVASVDIVTTPATNVGLFESQEADDMPSRKPKTVKLRERVEAAPEDHPIRKVLVEMMDMGEEPIGDMDVPAEASPEQAMKDAAIAAITAKIADAGESEIADLLAALGMADSISGILGGGSAAPAAPAEAPSEAPAEESAKIAERMNLIEAENMLLRARREATQARIKAVAAVPQADRKQLVESWPTEGVSGSVQRPGASPPARNGQQADNYFRKKWEARATQAAERVTSR